MLLYRIKTSAREETGSAVTAPWRCRSAKSPLARVQPGPTDLDLGNLLLLQDHLRSFTSSHSSPTFSSFSSSLFSFFDSGNSAVMQAFRRNTLSALQNASKQQQRRTYVGASAAYASTANNLRINGDTRVIFQGFTGKQGTYVVNQSFSL
jgi:hypothetical protein